MKNHQVMFQTVMIVVCLLNYTCDNSKQKKATPIKFVSHVKVAKGEYTRDSVEIVKQLYSLLRERQDFFNNSAYFDSTKIIIDSILYSPGHNKFAVFVLMKNPTYRQLLPN